VTVDWILPFIKDNLPPVTRAMTLLTVAGPKKMALSPVVRQNSPEALEEVAADLLAGICAGCVIRPRPGLRR
jgi:hypothetical protein